MSENPAADAAADVITVTLTLMIENHYEFYPTVLTTATVTIPAPPNPGDEAAYDEWAYDHIYPQTGTGHEDGDSWYFVDVIESTDPTLLRHRFEFGQ